MLMASSLSGGPQVSKSAAHGTNARQPLPSTRSLRRSRPLRTWYIAVAIAVGFNLTAVVLLAQVSHLHQPGIEPPLAVRSMRQVEAEPPLPPPTPTEPQVTETVVEAVPVAPLLPSLDLPSMSSNTSFSLPALGSVGADLALPMRIPTFTVPSAPMPSAAMPVAAAATGSGPPVLDQQAEREGAFDLDRHYPRAARRRGVTGSTRIRITIDATGAVSEVQVLSSTPGGVFESAAERLARSLRFRPAKAAGKAVASVQDTTIEWTIK